MEIYGALVAALFAGLGIWLGQTLTRKKPAVIIKEVQAQARVQPMGSVRRRRDARGPARDYTSRDGDSWAHRHGVEQPGDFWAAIRQRNSVKTHSSRLFDKLGAKRRTQAVQIGKTARLIP